MTVWMGNVAARGMVWRSRAIVLLSVVALLFMAYLLFGRHLPDPGPPIPLPPPPPPLPPPPRAPARLLPYQYWQHRRDHPDRYLQLSCSKLPDSSELLWAAASWQRLVVPQGSLYLYAAHWDPRPAEPLVRLLVYCDVAPLLNLTCLLWYEDRNAPEAVPAVPSYGWRPEWGGPTDTVNEPYILGCRIPQEDAAPQAVSVVIETCESPRNILAIQGAPQKIEPRRLPDPNSVAVCIKWLNYKDDASGDLIEWIELVRAFGAQKLFVYILQAHPNMRRVLAHYHAIGFADVTDLDHAPREREIPPNSFRAMRRELLPLNDALYRAMPHYAWLAVFDMDELIVPLKNNTWSEVIAETLGDTPAEDIDCIVCRNMYFLGGAQREHAAPPPAHMLADVWRAREPSNAGDHVKSFHSTSGVISMHNHMPITCFHGDHYCSGREVPLDVGRLQHYRYLCDSDRVDCPELHDVVRDPTLSRFRGVLRGAAEVLRDLRIPLPTERPLAQNIDSTPEPETNTEKTTT